MNELNDHQNKRNNRTEEDFDNINKPKLRSLDQIEFKSMDSTSDVDFEQNKGKSSLASEPFSEFISQSGTNGTHARRAACLGGLLVVATILCLLTGLVIEFKRSWDTTNGVAFLLLAALTGAPAFGIWRVLGLAW